MFFILVFERMLTDSIQVTNTRQFSITQYDIINYYNYFFFFFFFFFFYKCFGQIWLNEEARIAQVANINQLPGTNGFTSPPKDAVMNTSSFLRVELSTLIGEKSLTLVGLEPATFRLQASTLTSRPLVPPIIT